MITKPLQNLSVWLLALLPGLGIALPAFSQTIQMSENTDRIAIAEYVEYYEDSSEALTIDDVLAPNFSVNFIPHDRDILHFCITNSAFWLRFNLDWSNMPDESSKVLEFGPPKIVAGFVRGGIELFVVDEQGNVENSFVLGNQASERELRTLSRGFALNIDREFGSQVYLRIYSRRHRQII